ncbi:MAG: Lrp/AsnC ligand binding domain-containing protein [archaeon]
MEIYILGKITPAKDKEILAELKSIDGITDAKIVMGKYDFMVRADVESLEKFDTEVMNKIRENPDVLSDETLIVQLTAE